MMAIATFGVFAAACGSDRAAAPTIPPAVTVSVADTAAATTTSPASPTTTTTSPTTTTLPATTTTIATETQIKQAVQDYITAYVGCGQVPARCDPSTFTASQGSSRSVVAELATGMAGAGLYFSTDVRGSYLVAESVDLVSDNEATALYCAYDGLIVLGPDGPDALPTVVNDNIVSRRYEYRLFFENGRWLVGQQHELERFAEGRLCPPAA